MVGIAFYFEPNDVDVYSGRRIDLDAWNYAAKAAGDVDRFLIVNRTDQHIEPPDADVPCQIVRELPELSGRVAWVCCPWNQATTKVSLWDFDHLVSWYAFGPAAGWQSRLPIGVYVPQSGRAALHAVHAATVVMVHRHDRRARR